jgi:hypothetical protein
MFICSLFRSNMDELLQECDECVDEVRRLITTIKCNKEQAQVCKLRSELKRCQAELHSGEKRSRVAIDQTAIWATNTVQWSEYRSACSLFEFQQALERNGAELLRARQEIGGYQLKVHQMNNDVRRLEAEKVIAERDHIHRVDDLVIKHRAELLKVRKEAQSEARKEWIDIDTRQRSELAARQKQIDHLQFCVSRK